MMPADAASTEEQAKAMIFTRVTGTPISLAASRPPPEAKIQLPNLVEVKTIVKIRMNTRNHRNVPGIAPHQKLNSSRNGYSTLRRMGKPPVMASTTAR